MPRDTNPFQGVSDFFSEAARMRQVAVGRQDYEHSPEDRHRTHATAWVPATDIATWGDDLVIRVDLAGVRPDEVDITFVGHVLSLDGTRHTEEDTDGAGSFYIRERFHGLFRRSITLPEQVEAEQIEAEFQHGLVEITVRGAATAASETPRRIELRDSLTVESVRRAPSKTRRGTPSG